MFSDPQHNIEQFMIGEGAKVADLGAGSGHYTIYAAKAAGESGKVFAVDIQPSILERIKSIAKENSLSNVLTIAGDLEKIGGSKLKDSSCNAGIAANVIFQIESKKTFADEAARVIRPGGKLLVVDWTDSFGGLGPHPDSIVSSDEVRQLFEPFGFSFDKNIYAGEHHFGLIFRKQEN